MRLPWPARPEALGVDRVIGTNGTLVGVISMPPHPSLLHQLQGDVNIIIRRIREQPARHHFTDRNIPRKTIARPESHANVSIRDHADNLAIRPHDRKESTVPNPYEFRCRSEIGIELAVVSCPRHCIFHFHLTSPSL